MAPSDRGPIDLASAETPSSWDLLRRQVPYWWTAYRRTWKGSAITAFVSPLLYVGAMGVLLGGYVDDGSAARSAGAFAGAASYLDFIAPGLLAATAMQIGTAEVMWPVMGAIKWDKTYFGMIATPLRVRDIVVGHLGFAMFRVLLSVVVFATVLAFFGVFASLAGALGSALAALLTALALTTPVYAWSAGATTEQGFALIYRIGLLPMFLFSGAFFPVSNLSAPLEWLARVTPLWHGVELTRMCSLGTFDAGAALAHVAYLGLLAALGVRWALGRLEGRLVV